MLTSVFGISIKCEAWKHQDSLPVYIAGSYDFQTAYIGNKRCIMLIPTEELATLPVSYTHLRSSKNCETKEETSWNGIIGGILENGRIYKRTDSKSR